MSGQQQKREKIEKISSSSSSEGVEKVLVAVKASKEIPKAALVWALSHVVQPGDCVTLIVVVPPPSSGRRLWVFPRFAGDCASGQKKLFAGTSSEQKIELTDSCSQMILQLHDVYDPNKKNVNIKIVSASPPGAVAAEAKKVQANWVVLDKHLKQEEKRCMDELHCNIVVMKRSQAKVLRLNLVGSPSTELLLSGPSGDQLDEVRGPVVTPSSSPELFTATEAGTSSVSSSDLGTSPFAPSIMSEKLKKGDMVLIKESRNLLSDSDSEDEDSSPCSTSSGVRPWMGEYIISHLRSSQKPEKRSSMKSSQKYSEIDRDSGIGSRRYKHDLDYSGNVREAMSLSRSAPLGPPPLCSICQHKAPVFGKPPRWFSYAELELATSRFSQSNFLAEGGYGSVHRGILPDGQAIAVKQHKLASSQGDVEFCSEVEVLSCAQHRNVVMLIGYCIEDKRRLLVYEYICNGSLDAHLYGRSQPPLEWFARQKIAVGAARGLRYLHEECRVGCIVHRDMRPNNILLTHDYEPLVGDFGLARWQPDGDTGVETRVIGTFGYLAPEYAQSGQITEKADVYSFGVVLVELLTGRKAVDLTRPKGQQCLTEWARPLLEESAIEDLIDPRLGNRYLEPEVLCLMHAASLCIRQDPHSRPRMSQVLRVLEGDMFMDSSALSTPRHDVGNRSGRMRHLECESYSGPLRNEETGVYTGSLSLESLRTALWERERLRISSDH
ncbi:inactive protein kinase SELMODRAFT_444075-like [Chenopodium quinoa]|uniref:inactive protein kinase SELMODRAFT_444075-like n=1 Tax=Chenopodium quinoa TaxID=63459 RepID=UPI000B79158F|nr:inactive protein kinase SELMODRAFT_444075-like [Chenopodium quinoa]XP_021754503.1 inactive protein kinase SELMODRAFT_444075-like [Chenopodium quinoa]XP_021754504.1 inactive protein kinase SELMODRAFT_444075-like [Chenopodium quinoa]